MEGLDNFLRDLSSIYSKKTNSLVISKSYIGPGYWSAACAYANAQKIPRENFVVEQDDTRHYASAIGISRALWCVDDYEFARQKEGQNYSPLEALTCQEATDVATSRINQCIRNHLTFGDSSRPFIRMLCNVVGDLHDNVWAHGRSSGFSIAQKWRVPRTDNDAYLEFALADAGIGFRAELKRVGIATASDAEAIDWCVQEGHSSKLVRPRDDWTQRLPPDSSNNPMGGIAKTFERDDHHQGLGLFKLLHLVEVFQGELWLATGNSMLVVDNVGRRNYYNLNDFWQGVAIACRFNSRFVAEFEEEEAPDEATQKIMGLLRGDVS